MSINYKTWKLINEQLIRHQSGYEITKHQGEGKYQGAEFYIAWPPRKISVKYIRCSSLGIAVPSKLPELDPYKPNGWCLGFGTKQEAINLCKKHWLN